MGTISLEFIGVLIFLALFGIAATHQDLRHRQIPDLLTAALAALAFLSPPTLITIATAITLTATLWLAGGHRLSPH